ncbi:MAG TPA: hypothetical protein VN256_09505 [Pyrinomonadaceae bacterium]|nr:hypothetical protein [Pyrinomonadaceae bacterium]
MDGDSPAVRETALMIAAAFENNPRRIKQFINSFRLKAYIVGNLGLLVPYGRPPAGERMTLQQLGKFVAISLRWPRLLADLDDDRELLAKLQRLALGRRVDAEAKDSPRAAGLLTAAAPFFWQGLDAGGMTPAEMHNRAIEYWGGRQPLMELLKRDCDGPEKEKLCTLAALEVDNLLKISPKLGTPTTQPSKTEVEATA